MNKFKNSSVLILVALMGTVFSSQALIAADSFLVGTYMLNFMVLRQPNAMLEIPLSNDTSLISSTYIAGDRGNYNQTAGLAAGLRFYDHQVTIKEVINESVDGVKRKIETERTTEAGKFEGSFLELKFGYSYVDFDSRVSYTYTSKGTRRTYTYGNRYVECLPGVEFAHGNSWRVNDMLTAEWRIGLTTYLSESESGISFSPLFDYGLRLRI